MPAVPVWGTAAGAQEYLVRGKRYYENRNYAAALPQLQDAAKEGYGEACYLLGRMYDFGLGVEQNYPIALCKFQRGLEYGSFSWREAVFSREFYTFATRKKNK